MIETRHIYHRATGGEQQIRIEVVYDTKLHTQTYLSYQSDETGPAEILIGHQDLPPLIDMLLAAQNAVAADRGDE